MIHKKHSFYPTLLAALWCVSPVVGLHAQDGGGQPRPPHGPPPSPLFDALDTNHDGVIDATEIANASTALKALLKNGATQITREDVRPPHPPRDDQSHPHPPFDHQDIRPHNPPSTGDPSADTSPTASPAADATQADHPHHRPPASEDQATRPHPAGPDSADSARPHPDMADQMDRPPHHPHSPPSPLFDALDTNHDGVISAEEMANAAESLKKLERNGSNQIKREDLKPSPPPPRQND